MSVLFRDDECYVLSIAKTSTGHYKVFSRFLSKEGKFLRDGGWEVFTSREFAEKKLARMAREKRRHGWEPVSGSLSQAITAWLPPDADAWIPNDELLQLVRRTAAERYAVIEDVSGLGACFERGVEYLAQETDDPGLLRVLDKFGQWTNCLRSRFSAVMVTEDAEEAQRILRKDESPS